MDGRAPILSFLDDVIISAQPGCENSSPADMARVPDRNRRRRRGSSVETPCVRISVAKYDWHPAIQSRASVKTSSARVDDVAPPVCSPSRIGILDPGRFRPASWFPRVDDRDLSAESAPHPAQRIPSGEGPLGAFDFGRFFGSCGLGAQSEVGIELSRGLPKRGDEPFFQMCVACGAEDVMHVGLRFDHVINSSRQNPLSPRTMIRTWRKASGV